MKCEYCGKNGKGDVKYLYSYFRDGLIRKCYQCLWCKCLMYIDYFMDFSSDGEVRV